MTRLENLIAEMRPKDHRFQDDMPYPVDVGTTWISDLWFVSLMSLVWKLIDRSTRTPFPLMFVPGTTVNENYRLRRRWRCDCR